MAEKKTIMAVGAHTGDAQLTCGMLLAKHAMAGNHIITVDLTAGERGTPPGMRVDEFRQQNVESAAAFAKMLGGKSVVFDVPDGELVHTQELAVVLADIMREHKVDTVLYHWENSIHKDHVAAHKITKDAAFFAALPAFERPLPPAPIKRRLYAENWEDSQGFVPYVYFDVTEAFPLWREAIVKLWLAENSRDFKYLRYYDALSITRGALIRTERATAYAVEETSKRVVLDFA